MQDATRQGKIISFFPYEKERKLCKKKRRRGERGGGGECLTFFKGVINSLSAVAFTMLSCKASKSDSIWRPP